MQLSANLQAFFAVDRAARFYPGMDPLPAAKGVVAGHEVEIKYVIANRKCYDNLATPTRLVKIDGKRVSLKDALALLV